MNQYSGGSKCGFNCGRLAHFEAERPNGGPHDMVFACYEHRHRIRHIKPAEHEPATNLGEK